jgi:hypothetical protein
MCQFNQHTSDYYVVRAIQGFLSCKEDDLKRLVRPKNNEGHRHRHRLISQTRPQTF